MSVKGDWNRPVSVTQEEKEWRYNLAFGKITEEEFNKKAEEMGWL